MHPTLKIAERSRERKATIFYETWNVSKILYFPWEINKNSCFHREQRCWKMLNRNKKMLCMEEHFPIVIHGKANKIVCVLYM